MNSRRSFLTALTGGALALASGWSLRAASGNLSGQLQSRLQALAGSLEGRLLVPSQSGYESIRRVASHNPLSNRFPAAIVLCQSENDVAKAVRFAGDNDLPLAVRAGGHDVLGQSSIDGGIVIDLRLLQQIQLTDSDRGLVRVDAGCLTGVVNAHLHTQGLAVPLACHPGVGVAGLTLGGGFGWLLGRYGAACDNVEAFHLVSADGQIQRAAADENEELFWGLRGGGGNFGVVTAIDYRAVRLAQVLRGFVVYDGRHFSEFLSFYNRFMASAPPELTVELVVTRQPDPLITATFCYCGDPEMGNTAVQSLFAFGPPLGSDVSLVPYARLLDVPPKLQRQFAPPAATQAPSQSEPSAGERFNYWRGSNFAELTEAGITELTEALQQAPADYSIGIGHLLHGRVCEVDPLTSPLRRPPGSMSYFLNASWSEGQENAMHWVNQYMQRLARYSSPSYINYLSSNDPTAVAQTYGRHMQRLACLKSRVDPDNRFRSNRNIRPDEGAGCPRQER